MKPVHILAVDIETSGCNYTKHGILSIGWCGGGPNGRIVNSGQINMSLPDGHGFEEKCWDEFWSKNQETLELLKKDAVSPQQGITTFAEVVDFYDQHYDLAIVSDNPSFDIGFLNYYLAVYLDRRPLTYKVTGEYRPVFDTDCYTRGVLNMQYDCMWTSDKDIISKLNIDTSSFRAHTHSPESDATRIYQLHTSVLSRLRQPAISRQCSGCPCQQPETD